MNKKPFALLLGILTLIPAPYIYLFTPYVVRAGLLKPTLQAQFVGFSAFNIALFMLAAFLFVFYYGHLYRSTAVPKRAKGSWAISLLMLNFLIMPIYWYRYIWSKK